MSFGYLIATSQPCELLTKSRGETFSLIMDKMDLWIYGFISDFVKEIFIQ